jgi:regulator of cell morphogenesis and NO signaling
MENLMKKTVGSIVAADYRTASVFEKNGIDFCCKGNTELSKACESRNIDSEQVVKELNAIGEKQTESIEFNSLSLDSLANYIEVKHHRYVRNTMPQLQTFLEKLCHVHGQRHPELKQIKELFDDGVNKLTSHMKKEELILFPYVRKLYESRRNATNPEPSQFGSVQNPINAMEIEHETEGNRFSEIRSITGNYTIPEDACTTYKVTYWMLKEFEEDLHIHIHLENNILFPKAIELEEFILHEFDYKA